METVHKWLLKKNKKSTAVEKEFTHRKQKIVASYQLVLLLFPALASTTLCPSGKKLIK